MKRKYRDAMERAGYPWIYIMAEDFVMPGTGYWESVMGPLIAASNPGAYRGTANQRMYAEYVKRQQASVTLTQTEREEIQRIAEKYNTTIDVVGSRADGKGRNVETNLPVGKAPLGKTRSDIDFRIDASHPRAKEMIEELKKVGNNAGSASKEFNTNDRPTEPPYIRFSPNK